MYHAFLCLRPFENTSMWHWASTILRKYVTASVVKWAQYHSEREFLHTFSTMDPVPLDASATCEDMSLPNDEWLRLIRCNIDTGIEGVPCPRSKLSPLFKHSASTRPRDRRFLRDKITELSTPNRKPHNVPPTVIPATVPLGIPGDDDNISWLDTDWEIRGAVDAPPDLKF